MGRSSLYLFLACLLTFSHALWAKGEKSYVGSRVCGDCHEEEFSNFQRYAKKAHSYQSILRVKKGLTEEELKGCYGCHTAGYGEVGGFVSGTNLAATTVMEVRDRFWGP